MNIYPTSNTDSCLRYRRHNKIRQKSCFFRLLHKIEAETHFHVAPDRGYNIQHGGTHVQSSVTPVSTFHLFYFFPFTKTKILKQKFACK